MDPLHPEKSEEDPARTKSREPPKSPTLALTAEITIARMATTAWIAREFIVFFDPNLLNKSEALQSSLVVCFVFLSLCLKLDSMLS